MQHRQPRVLLLRQIIGWHAKQSGYDPVFALLQQQFPLQYSSTWKVPGKVWNRRQHALVRVLLRPARPSRYYSTDSARAELRAFIHAFKMKPDIVHLTYAEDQMAFLPSLIKWFLPRTKVVATFHQPPSWTKGTEYPSSHFAKLDGIVVLSKEHALHLKNQFDGPIFHILYGIDTDFFSPSNNERPTCRVIVCGRHLRDFATLVHVVDIATRTDPRIQFDVVIPQRHEGIERRYLDTLQNNPNVHLHDRVSDGELQMLYRCASVFLHPVLDSTANTALLEAVSSGLPVVSNDIGGIPDYMDDSFADLLPVGDAVGMANALLRLTGDRVLCRERGDAARRFAVEYFSIERCAHEHADAYDKIGSGNR
jgi:glycosyltransferase involved in cell wall biosynthesis